RSQRLPFHERLRSHRALGKPCAPQLSRSGNCLKIRTRNQGFRGVWFRTIDDILGRKTAMRARHHLLTTTFASALVLLPAALCAQAQTALSGVVTSAEEAKMEGVVVSAKKDGSTITISVVTDDQGRFAFPAARLEPGTYTLKARAAGYELPGKNAAEVAAGQEA